MTSPIRRGVLVTLLVLASLGVGFGLHAALNGVPPGSRPAPPPGGLATPDTLQQAFTQVADQVRPAVVNIGTVTLAKGRRPVAPSPFSDDPLFKDFFEQFFGGGQGPRGEFKQPSLGSGVIIDKQGLVLTNFHVVKGADEITVRLSSKKEYRGRVVGYDPKTDLAVVRFQPDSELTVARLGNSDTLKVGEWAIAIGNPFGLDQTVTVGVISATGRADVGIATYENFIQTDASINPGNSGGPLLNLDGKVIGINTAIVATGQGIGFSIPVNMAKDVMAQLIKGGRVVRGWLGIVIQDLSDELAAGFGVAPRTGVLVADVMKDSPAEAAGLRAGDIIVEFGGRATPEVPELQRRVAATPPGQPIPLTVLRDKKQDRLTVKLGEMPGEETLVAAAPARDGWGLRVAALTAELAQRYDLTAREGVVVMDVAPGSPGERAGIRPGDAILEVDRRPVKSVEAFQQALAQVKPGEGVPVYPQRGGGRNEYIVLKGPEPK